MTRMKAKIVKARVNKKGLMNSATRIETPKKGKGSYRRSPKHKGGLELNGGSSSSRASTGAERPDRKRPFDCPRVGGSRTPRVRR